MKKTFKRSLSVLLSVLMVLSVLSAGMFTAAADTDFTMIAVVAMKPEEGAEYCTTRFIFNATEEDLTALNGGPVDLGSYGYEAQWGIIPATSENPHERVDGNWGLNTWGYDENGHLYFATKFPLIGGTTPAEEYAAAGRGELAGIVREFADAAVQDGIVEDALGRAFCPDLKANTILDGMDAVRQVLTVDEVYYAEPVTTKTVMLNNCDSADGWAPYPGDGLELTTDKKTEGTGAIHTFQGGGFCQGGPVAGLDLTGLKSVSFDFAANTAEALSGPSDVAFYLFSGDYAINAERGDRYYELNEVDTSKVMAFDVDAIRTGYGKDDQSFVTITTTPTAVGENFDITNVTGFYFWGCSNYSGDHEQWLDNVVANVETKEDAAVKAVIDAIAALPEADAVVAADRYAIFEAEDAYNALTDAQKAEVTNADKLTAVVAAVNAFKTKSEVVLDECTEASVANWKAADSCAWQNEAVNIWWPLRARVKFAEVKNLLGCENVFIDWTGSAQEAEFGGDSPFETVFSRDLAEGQVASDYGMVLTSHTGDLSVVDKISDSEAYTVYGAPLVVTGDVVAGENTFAIDYAAAGEKFDASKVTGMVFVGRDGGQSTYFHALKAIKESWPVDEATQAVIDAIDALPENVTLEDADAVNAAKAAFDALSPAAQADVSNVAKLNAAKAAIDELMSKAEKIGIKTDWMYTSYYGDGYVFAADEGKTYTLKAKIKAVPGETDSRYIAKLQMFTDGDDQSTKFMLSDYNALPEETDAKYGYTYKTLTAQFTATLNADYKPVFIYGGKAGELHNAAVTFYGMEIYDGDTLLDYYDNAAKAVDAGDVNLLEDEAGGPYWSYVYGVVDHAYEVVEAIDALPSVDDLQTTDISKVYAVNRTYEALTEEQKARVSNADKLAALMKKIQDDFGDEAIAADFVDSIRALPDVDDVRAEDEDAIMAVFDRIPTLTSAQVAIIRDKYNADIQRLYAIKARLDKIIVVKYETLCTCVQDTEDVFDFCGNDHATKDGALWMNITVGSASYPNKEGYNAVYVRVGRFFGEEEYTHTFNYNDYYQFEVLVNPDKDNVWNITHGNEFNNLEWQFPSEINLVGNKWQRASVLMSDIGKSFIQAGTPTYDLSAVNLLHILQRYEGAFTLKNIAIVSEGYATARAFAEKDFQEAVAAIGEVTADSGAAIEKAKAAREELNKWINVATDENMAASAALDKAVFDFAMLDPANADVKDAYDKIAALPETIALENKDAVEAAKAAFDALTDAKKKVIPADMQAKLAKAVEDLDDIIVLDPIRKAIEELTDPDAINYENIADVKAAVAAIRESVNALTEAQLTKLDTSKLEAVESKIAELENDQVVAKSVEDAINALPELADMTAEKVADVTLVGVQFDALSDAQKSLISDAAKTKLEELRAWQPEDPTVYGDVDGDGEVTVTDALMVLQHSVGKITLADSVLKNADVDGEAGITVADALAILQASVNKVSLPFVKEA